jgi:hypothetical protein
MAELLSKYVAIEKILVTPLWSIFQKNEKVPASENPFIKEHKLEGKFVVQYSGNIGLSHRVEIMVELAEILKDKENILFQIIGRGPRVPHLQKLVSEKKLHNCLFLPFQSDEMFPYSLSAADLGVVILDDEVSKGSVPSKTYNLMSFGIPSLYIASRESELYKYAREYNNGKCFGADQLNEAAEFILQLYCSKGKQKEYTENALRAAMNFRRTNADKIVEYYLS